MATKHDTFFISMLMLLCTATNFIASNNLDEMQEQLSDQLSNSNISVDSVKNLVRDKCINVSGAEKGASAFEEIEKSTTVFTDCLTEILNYTKVKNEIDAAIPQGELDVVFNKYCNKRPEALQCVEAFNSKLDPCLEADEKDNQKVFMKIVRSLLDFVCHKGGDQIALFIAEKGPECLESKRNEIQNCLNSTFSDVIPKNGFDDIKSLPKFILGKKECQKMKDLEDCVVEHLEKCEEITPANIVESMFRFIRKETICNNTQPISASQVRSFAKSIHTTTQNAITSLYLLLSSGLGYKVITGNYF